MKKDFRLNKYTPFLIPVRVNCSEEFAAAQNDFSKDIYKYIKRRKER